MANSIANGDSAGIHFGEKSLALVLGKDSAEVGCGRAIIVPMWTAEGEIKGVLAVCADSLMTLRRQTVEETISPLEALAMKLGSAVENDELSTRLQQIEKLAGASLLATGVAHALSDPLMSALEFAELIGETAKEPRIRAHADAIAHEVRRMQQTARQLEGVERIRPLIDDPVNVSVLMKELAAECREKLEERGVRLEMELDDDLQAIRGDRDRLQQVLEHLLNNAAQAIASIEEETEREHEIRISVSRDEDRVQILISDTGPGFTNPESVFDPLHPERQAGLGLTLCYGIVREHEGEISAFNLHPYGAAVVVELPLGQMASQSFPGVAREVA